MLIPTDTSHYSRMGLLGARNVDESLPVEDRIMGSVESITRKNCKDVGWKPNHSRLAAIVSAEEDIDIGQINVHLLAKRLIPLARNALDHYEFQS